MCLIVTAGHVAHDCTRCFVHTKKKKEKRKRKRKMALQMELYIFTAGSTGSLPMHVGNYPFCRENARFSFRRLAGSLAERLTRSLLHVHSAVYVPRIFALGRAHKFSPLWVPFPPSFLCSLFLFLSSLSPSVLHYSDAVL